MARKKYKIKLDGLEMTASNSWDIKEIETACTLAAIQQRSEGHLAVYDKFMNMSLEIKKQLSEQMGQLNDTWSIFNRPYCRGQFWLCPCSTYEHKR